MPSHFLDEEHDFYHEEYATSPRRVFSSSRTRAHDDHFARRTSEFLRPNQHNYTTGLHRTRSQGNSPSPNVTIINRMENESSPNVRTEQRSPAGDSGFARGRTRRMPGEWSYEDELAELRLEVARQRRSRSRSAHHHHPDDHDYDKWQLQQANQRLKDAEDKIEWERREELIRRKMELKSLKDRHEREEEEARIKAEESRLKRDWELRYEKEDRKRIAREDAEQEQRKRIIAEEQAKYEKEELKRLQRQKEHEEERKRIIMENTMKIEKADREAKEARQRAVDQFEKEKAEKEAKAKADRERVVAEYEAKKISDAAKAKQAREELLLQIKMEEEKEKRKQKEEYERFLLIQKQKEQEEKDKKAKQEKELEEQMRQRLAHFGFQENQIQAMIKPEEARKLQQGYSPADPLRLGQQPTYVKVHREHLSVDTLTYYQIPYEYDRTDPNFIIILREMEPRETEILFEHTRRLRTHSSSRLLIEERHDHGGKNDYAWVRRRKPSRSPSRRRSSPKRVVGIKEMFY